MLLQCVVDKWCVNEFVYRLMNHTPCTSEAVIQLLLSSGLVQTHSVALSSLTQFAAFILVNKGLEP